jgi:hypothetical protein
MASRRWVQSLSDRGLLQASTSKVRFVKSGNLFFIYLSFMMSKTPLNQSTDIGLKSSVGRSVYFGNIDKRLSHQTKLVEKGETIQAKTYPYDYFPLNEVSSAKYTLWNFLPLQVSSIGWY